MKNFTCAQCKALIKQDTAPRPTNCSSGGVHQWLDMGNAGETNYQCETCFQFIQSSEPPATHGCTATDSHHWTKV